MLVKLSSIFTVGILSITFQQSVLAFSITDDGTRKVTSFVDIPFLSYSGFTSGVELEFEGNLVESGDIVYSNNPQETSSMLIDFDNGEVIITEHSLVDFPLLDALGLDPLPMTIIQNAKVPSFNLIDPNGVNNDFITANNIGVIGQPGEGDSPTIGTFASQLLVSDSSEALIVDFLEDLNFSGFGEVLEGPFAGFYYANEKRIKRIKVGPVEVEWEHIPEPSSLLSLLAIGVGGAVVATYKSYKRKLSQKAK